MTHHPLYVGKRISNERGYRISLSYETNETSQGTIQDKTILQLKVRRCKITLTILQLKERLVWYHTNRSST